MFWTRRKIIAHILNDHPINSFTGLDFVSRKAAINAHKALHKAGNNHHS